MKLIIKKLIVAGLLSTLFNGVANASSVSYILNQSNIETVMPDGVPYLTVLIEDGQTFGADTNAVKFTVDALNAAFTTGGITLGDHFGIRDFAFNLATGAPTVQDSNIIGPNGWVSNIVPPNNQLDGFGRFIGDTKGTGTNRFDPLVFWITGVSGDSVTSYAAPSTNGNGGPAAQGNAWFAAHVGDFVIPNSNINSGYFGGGNGNTPPPLTPVPLPATGWLLLSGLAMLGRRIKQST